MSERIAKLKQALAADGLGALVVTKGSDIKYLTGFTGEYGTSVLIISPAGNHFVTDGRFESQAKTEVGDEAEVHVYLKWQKEPQNYFTCAGDILADLGVREAGIVPEDITLADYRDLERHAGSVELKSVGDLVAPIRMIKDAGEIATIKRACQISMRSFYALLDSIKPGVTEIDVANELEHQFRSHGGAGYCFETIVASGPDNGACPHASVSGRKLEYGDFVTIDFGTFFDGYCSDITRTMVLGRAKEPEMYKIWDIVEQAKELGASMLEPGVTYAEVSNAVNAFVEGHGYSIPHGIGHSFGLDIHEAPFMGPANTTPEAPGMVHTIEPGVYVPGMGGVRQEDDYLITEDGCERLTYITDHLIEL